MEIRKTTIDTLIILGTAFLILFFCETILRIVYPEKVKTYPEHMKNTDAYEFNEDYIVSLKPNAKKNFIRSQINGGQIIEWRTNKDSFRGSELRENHDFRIMVYGDSSIQARFSVLENTFTCKLEKYLRRIVHEDIEVTNAGVVGFGPDQSLIKFMHEAETYRPDIVIFSVCADNDFGDIIRNRLFELDSSGSLVTPHFRSNLRTFLSSLLITKAAQKMFRKVTREDKNKDKKQDRKEKLTRLLDVSESEYSVYRQSEPRTFSHFADHYDIDIALYPESEASTTKIKLMKAVLCKAKQFADAKKIEFIVLIIPSSKDLTTNSEPNYEDFLEYPKYKRDNLTSAVDHICTENNIHRVNLFHVFLENDPQDLHFKKNDYHWNDAGQDVAAQEMAFFMSRYIL